jgi:hypothetical protein
MGDVVAADKTFMDVHLQNSNYLASRECQLSEDLIRAIKAYDHDALEQAKTNRALASVDPSIRNAAASIKISGKAPRKKVVADKVANAANSASMNAAVGLSTFGTTLSSMAGAAKAAVGAPKAAQSNLNSDDLHDEMDNLMNDMGLESDEDDGDDDDIDLR